MVDLLRNKKTENKKDRFFGGCIVSAYPGEPKTPGQI